jgi:hypothetical protein
MPNTKCLPLLFCVWVIDDFRHCDAVRGRSAIYTIPQCQPDSLSELSVGRYVGHSASRHVWHSYSVFTLGVLMSMLMLMFTFVVYISVGVC